MTPSAETKSVAEGLLAAAALIEPEGAWTQGYFARGKSGRMVYSLSRSAVSWCITGALTKATDTCARSTAEKAAKMLRNSLRTGNLVEFNDAPERTQAEVVSALRQAAALAQEEAK